MNEAQLVTQYRDNPEQLESLYQQMRSSGATAVFAAELETAYSADPQNLLLAAWHYRLKHATADADSARSINWGVAVPIAVVLGLLFWLLFDPNEMFLDSVPLILIFWAPLTAVAVLTFLALASRLAGVTQSPARTVAAAGALALVTLYAYLMAPRLVNPDYYLQQIAIQLPLLAWAAVAFAVIGWRDQVRERFAFLTKSLEAAVTGGVFLIVLLMFAGLTITMFNVLGTDIDETWLELLVFGSAGFVPVLAVALVYDPARGPSEQIFHQGVGRVVPALFRLMIPLTLIVLVVYVIAIPFNFRGAFENRDTLIVYNVVQFAVVGLLLAATPLELDDLQPRARPWLRGGIIAVALLALLVSLYAFAAIVTRTAEGAITMNRLTFIGWNVINIALLVMLLWRQLRAGADWVLPIQKTYSQWTAVYAAWALAMTLLVPLLFD